MDGSMPSHRPLQGPGRELHFLPADFPFIGAQLVPGRVSLLCCSSAGDMDEFVVAASVVPEITAQVPLWPCGDREHLCLECICGAQHLC